MMISFCKLRAAGLVAITSAVAALAVSACSNGAAATPPAQSVAQTRPIAAASPPSYDFVTVEYPSAATTLVTGINDNNGIIGTYQDYGSSDFQSFTSSGAPYNSFSLEHFDGKSVVMQSTAYVSGATKEAGWVRDPNAQTGTWGLIHDINGNWTALRMTDQGKNCWFMQLFGINEAGVAVGIYYANAATGSGCTQYDMQYSLQNQDYQKKLGPPSSTNPVITGINNNADLVGYYQPTGSGPKEGWYDLCSGGATGEGCTGGYDGVVEVALYGSTTLNGINDNRLVVGTVASSGVTQGFIENAANPGVPIQYINAGGQGVGASTYLNGINNNDYICGWYATNGSSNYEGFVGVPTIVDARRKPQRRSR